MMLSSSSFRWYTSLFSVVVSAAVVVFAASALVVTNATTATATLGGTTTTAAAVTEDAEEARWLIATGSWGTASFQSPGGLRSAVVSYADAEGTIYFYLMGGEGDGTGTGSSNTGFFAGLATATTTNTGVTFTVSEAALAPTSNFGHAACGTQGQTDPEDPRCAKLSVHGTLAPCPDDQDAGQCTHRGQAVLFARHPEMATWPVDHQFTVYTLTIHDLWMISNYGGGSSIPSAEYYAVTPQHHPKYTTTPTAIDVSSFSSTQKTNLLRPHMAPPAGAAPQAVPAWNQKVARTRWIVGHSLWTTVSTTSVRLNGAAWGNIRSIVDGAASTTLEDSTGTPVFYLPTPDPTNVDVLHDATIALSFSEASLSERLDPETHTKVCNGLDPMDPLCGQVMMVGTAVKIDGTPATTLHAFKTRHPLAPWLSEGGAHTGGNYYTIQPTYITLLDYYGGATDISIDEYLAWTPTSVPTTTATLSSKSTVAAAVAVMTAKLLRGVSD